MQVHQVLMRMQVQYRPQSRKDTLFPPSQVFRAQVMRLLDCSQTDQIEIET